MKDKSVVGGMHPERVLLQYSSQINPDLVNTHTAIFSLGRSSRCTVLHSLHFSHTTHHQRHPSRQEGREKVRNLSKRYVSQS
jgi:hypothetical protein